uniref:Uncharacterized protein n=1 Tax=Opuntia streptacantha TaxID=393608 RepID=A0A7C9AHI0_OPUST
MWLRHTLSNPCSIPSLLRVPCSQDILRGKCLFGNHVWTLVYLCCCAIRAGRLAEMLFCTTLYYSLSNKLFILAIPFLALDLLCVLSLKFWAVLPLSYVGPPFAEWSCKVVLCELKISNRL